MQAAAGFGKTQLLVHWHRAAAERGDRVGWLSLPTVADDAEVRRLVSLVVAPGQPVATTTSALLSRLAAQPSALFIDNCTAGTPLIASLAAKLPRDCRLVLAGRSLPLVPETTVRIDVTALSFSEAESRAILRARLPETDADRISLLARTCDGWPLAFNLAEAFIMEDGAAGGRDIAPLVGELSGLVATLLTDGVDAATKGALAEISILNIVTEPLAGAVTGRDDMTDALARGVQMGLFVTSERSPGLRPARFAADLLSAWRRAIPDARLASLHRAAADWFAGNTRPLDAIHHALAAGEMEQAARLLGANLLYMVAGGDFDRALAWVSTLPDARIMADDALRFSVALVHVVAGERREAERYLLPGPAAEQLLFRTLLANFADDPDTGALLLARIPDPGAVPTTLRPLHANMTRWIEQSRGNFAPLGSDASHPTDVGGDPVGLTFDNCFRLFREAQRYLANGQASAAVALLEAPLARAERDLGRDSFPATLLSLAMAGALGQLGAWQRSAAVLAGRGVTRGSQLAVDALAFSMTAQARLAFARGEFADGEAVIVRFLHVATERGLIRLEAICLAERMRSRGADLDRAALTETITTLLRIAADAERFEINGPWIRLPALLGAAHAARHAGSADQAAALLDDVATLARALDQTMILAEVAILRAALPAFDAASNREASLPPIDHADASTLAARLQLTLPPGLAVAQAPEQAAALDPVVVIGTRSPALALTAREEDVLACLMLSQSNKSIARTLNLSHETVKWHISNLFNKLDVRDRRGLVRRSRELGLLSDRRLVEAEA